MNDTTNSVWKTHPSRPNEVLEKDGYYISYNPNTNNCPFTQFGQRLGIGEGEEGEETAMYGSDGKWRILKGDFRKEYERCKTENECLAMYESNKNKRGDWSSSDV